MNTPPPTLRRRDSSPRAPRAARHHPYVAAIARALPVAPASVIDVSNVTADSAGVTLAHLDSQINLSSLFVCKDLSWSRKQAEVADVGRIAYWLVVCPPSRHPRYKNGRVPFRTEWRASGPVRRDWPVGPDGTYPPYVLYHEKVAGTQSLCSVQRYDTPEVEEVLPGEHAACEIDDYLVLALSHYFNIRAQLTTNDGPLRSVSLASRRAVEETLRDQRARFADVLPHTKLYLLRNRRLASGRTEWRLEADVTPTLVPAGRRRSGSRRRG